MRCEWRYGVAVFWFALCIGVSPMTAHGEDAYLAEIEQEAQRLEMLKTAERMDAASASGQPADRLLVSTGLTHEQFEQELRQRFLGTNMLYEKLSAKARTNVYAAYQRDNRIMELRRVIAEHL